MIDCLNYKSDDNKCNMICFNRWKNGIGNLPSCYKSRKQIISAIKTKYRKQLDELKNQSSTTEETKPPKKEVYCIDCKHLYSAAILTDGPGSCPDTSGPRKVCHHPNNITTESTWYKKDARKKRLNPPHEINKNNDCEWYAKN